MGKGIEKASVGSYRQPTKTGTDIESRPAVLLPAMKAEELKEAAEKVAERIRRDKNELSKQHIKLKTDSANLQVPTTLRPPPYMRFRPERQNQCSTGPLWWQSHRFGEGPRKRRMTNSSNLRRSLGVGKKFGGDLNSPVVKGLIKGFVSAPSPQ
eukprot:3896612-Pyramimonas_sp.AAC.1